MKTQSRLKVKPLIAGLTFVAATVAFPSCATWRFLTYRVSPDPPEYRGEVEVKGIAKPVRVVFDRFAVPHVSAESDADMAFAVGYLHARERLFQMELLRAAAGGRLAEMFGDRPRDAILPLASTLAVDRWFRTVGLARAGEKAAKELDPQTRAVAEAYVAGVNEYVGSGTMPIELRLIDVKPAPWTPADMMTIARINGWFLSMNMPQELIRYLLRAELGEKRQNEIFPPFDHPGPTIVEQPQQGALTGDGGLETGVLGRCNEGYGVRDTRYADRQSETCNTQRPPPASHPLSVTSRLADLPSCQSAGSRLKTQDSGLADAAAWHPAALSVLSLHSEISRTLRPYLPPDASNNWVLGPSKTKSGKPILANDPHLNHGAPGVFYAMHQKTPNYDVIGVTMPGTPVIVLGHNRDLAWGLTTTFADTQDIYLEKTDPADRSKYLTPAGSERFRVVREVIRERLPGGGFTEHQIDLRFTRHGVVLNDALGGLLAKDAPILALKTTMEEKSDEPGAMFALARAKTVAEAKAALSPWGVPIQNWVLSDSAGHIGYYAAGLVPKRKGWDGTFPVPGWTGEFEWDGFIPREELPQMWDPPSGMIVTANNKVVKPGAYPWPFSLDAAPGYRAGRIVEVLSGKDKWTADDVRQLQIDTYVKQADRLLPPLLDALKPLEPSLDGRAKAALAALRSWDKRADADSTGASVFFSVYREAWSMALSDDLSPELYRLVCAYPYISGFFDRLWAEVPGSKIFDLRKTREMEGRDDVLRLAFFWAVENLSGQYGPDVSEWKWGRLHTITFEHAFGEDESVRGTFNVGPFGIAGAHDTVWEAGWMAWDKNYTFTVKHGPAFRHVIDFGAPAAGGMVVDLGQSGWAGTDYYANAVEHWKEGRLWPLSMDEPSYSESALGTLRIVPAR